MTAVKRVLYRFKVTGNTAFPIDMLRYDRCFPASARDAGLITSAMTYDNNGALTVDLLTYQERKHWMPNSARWKSFQWEVHPSGVEEVV